MALALQDPILTDEERTALREQSRALAGTPVCHTHVTRGRTHAEAQAYLDNMDTLTRKIIAVERGGPEAQDAEEWIVGNLDLLRDLIGDARRWAFYVTPMGVIG